MRTLKKCNILRVSLVVFLSLLLSLSVIIVVGIGNDKAFAEWTNEGGVDHYTDMASDGVDLEYYDILYNYNWFVCDSDLDIAQHKSNESGKIKGKLSDNWKIANDTLLRFYPSTKNTTASFVWKFNYTPTTVAQSGMNIYPLSAQGWKGAAPIDVAQYFTEIGKTYKVEFGVVKVKNNTQYYIFLKVDGVFKIGNYSERKVVNGYGSETDYSGLYFYLTAGEGIVSISSDMTDFLENYITVQNADIGAPEIFSDTGYNNYYSAITPFETSSMAYKFKFKSKGATYVTIRDAKQVWGGYHLIINGRALQFYLSKNQTPDNQYTLYNMISEATVNSGEFVVEFGAVDIKNSENSILFVKINGEYKLYEIVEKRGSEYCGVGVWGAESEFSQVDNSSAIEYEAYDELDNCDWKLGDDTSIGDIWVPTKGTDPVISFEPSVNNATASFVWNFTYIPTIINNNLNMFPMSAGGWNSSLSAPIVYGSYFTEIGREYSVEFGVKKLKNSDKYHIYLSVDGERKISLTSTRKGDEYTKVMVYPAEGEGSFNAVNYKFEINSADGINLALGTLKIGDTPEYDASRLTVDGKLFIGYEYNGKLYKTLEETVEERESGKLIVTAKTVNLEFLGAALKVNADKTDATIRFTSKIAKSDADSVADYGVIFTTTAAIDEVNGIFTHKSLEHASYFYDVCKSKNMNVKDEGNAIIYYVYLESISLANYGVEFSSRPYVKVDYESGSDYVYVPYSKSDNSRSVYSVAKMAIIDNDTTSEVKALCKGYINGVIELDIDYKLVEVDKYERDYDVIIGEEDSTGYRTISLKAKNFFNLRKIGGIYVDGKKMSIASYSFSDDTATIKIAVTSEAEEDIKKKQNL